MFRISDSYATGGRIWLDPSGAKKGVINGSQ